MSDSPSEQPAKTHAPGPLESLGKRLDELPPVQAAEAALRRARDELEKTLTQYRGAQRHAAAAAATTEPASQERPSSERASTERHAAAVSTEGPSSERPSSESPSQERASCEPSASERSACEESNVGDWIARVLRYVSRHPTQGVLVSGAIGFVLGRLLRRR
jgi:ElaB/YqjD/DUF883 family membrane-anchored ribosome-binding protein